MSFVDMKLSEYLAHKNIKEQQLCNHEFESKFIWWKNENTEACKKCKILKEDLAIIKLPEVPKQVTAWIKRPFACKIGIHDAYNHRDYRDIDDMGVKRGKHVCEHCGKEVET